ncbi:MAG: ABC transporter ATP-binding protein [Bacilli bacterium]
MNILEVKNLTRTYGKNNNKIFALDDVSFSVKKGEFIAIVGTSGSGKSTLLHILGGVDKPTNGTVLISEKDIYKLNDDSLTKFRRRNIGLIYQFYNLLPMLNVKENIELPLQLDKKIVKKEDFEEIIKVLDIENRLKHLPNELSGGQKQRVAIGRALITKPSIILADEATGNLDSKTSEEIINLFKRLNKNFNQTIIMITHNLDIASEADRIITIKDGKIISDEVKEHENN